MNKWISEQPSPWRESCKRESCYGDRVYVPPPPPGNCVVLKPAEQTPTSIMVLPISIMNTITIIVSITIISVSSSSIIISSSILNLISMTSSISISISIGMIITRC